VCNPDEDEARTFHVGYIFEFREFEDTGEDLSEASGLVLLAAKDSHREGRPGAVGRVGPAGDRGFAGVPGVELNKRCTLETRLVQTIDDNGTPQAVFLQATAELIDDSVTGFALVEVAPETCTAVTIQVATCDALANEVHAATIGIRRAIIESYYVQDQ
jgi:hypothetical protein